MLDKIILDLGDNYKIGDNKVLENIIDNVTNEALLISNRTNDDKNKKVLEYEIIETVKRVYLQRGSEDVSNRSESGINSSYHDAIEKLRNDIVKNGKRILK